jgi:outer membrane biosynthesis protein TonB
MMKNKAMLWIVVVVVAGVAITSCKKADTPEPPARFDPQIDGIAVRPLPPLDYATAQDVIRRQRAAARADRETPAPPQSVPEIAPTPEAQPTEPQTPPVSPHKLPPAATPAAEEPNAATTAPEPNDQAPAAQPQ